MILRRAAGNGNWISCLDRSRPNERQSDLPVWVAPIDLTKLNLDSDGAFRAAEKEASRNQVGFDSVNYRLSVRCCFWPASLECGDVRLRATPSGNVRVAAGNGTLLSAGNWVSEGRGVRGPQPPATWRFRGA